jgi:hypothetical protein
MAGREEDSGGSWLKTFLTSLPGVLTGLAALLTAIGALAGVLVTRGGDEDKREGGVGTSAAQHPRPQVKILSPKLGQHVGWQTPVIFRYSRIGKYSALWLIERADKYYPQIRCPGEQNSVARHPTQQNGTWRQPVYVGLKNAPSGATYELLVLLTTRQASRRLSEQIRGWCDRPQYPGLSKLPGEVKDSVTVYR